jgi:hypothetical protein
VSRSCPVTLVDDMRVIDEVISIHGIFQIDAAVDVIGVRSEGIDGDIRRYDSGSLGDIYVLESQSRRCSLPGSSTGVGAYPEFGVCVRSSLAVSVASSALAACWIVANGVSSVPAFVSLPFVAT